MSGDRYFDNVATVRDVNLKGQRVLVRVDFNVPLGKGGGVEDDFRIRSSLPTLSYILEQGGKPILVSHLGRPKGKRMAELSMSRVAPVLEGLIGVPVHLAPDCVGDEVTSMSESLPPGEVLLLENSRFHSEETSNEAGFAEALALLADVYVNDAFGTAHRAHATTEGVTHHLKPAVAGFLMEREIEFLGNLISNPERPFVAVIGGAKISGKIEVLQNLLHLVDSLLVGGGIANTFLKVKGQDMGASLVEGNALGVAREIIDSAETGKASLLLPVDFIVADKVEPGAATAKAAAGDRIPEGHSVVDIGGLTLASYLDKIAGARTIFWNGPLGVFEIEGFDRGTLEMARGVAAASDRGAISVIGGGDTASAVAKAGVKDKITHVSTGGGASLEFVEGKELPGIAALSKRGDVQK
jgi:phosphoglycerate kinase